MKSLQETLGRELTPSEEKRRKEIGDEIARRMDTRLDAATLGAATSGVRGNIAGQYGVIIERDMSEDELDAAREERQKWIVAYVEERAKSAESAE